MRTWTLPALLSVVAMTPTVGHAQIHVGPYTFPDATSFAASATYSGPGPTYVGGATTVDQAVAGYTPTTAIVNIGYNGAATVELQFPTVRIQNRPGPDAVVFDARYSSDDYEIAVGSVGAAASAYRAYLRGTQVATGVSGPPATMLYGIEVDLTDFGLPPGAVVDRLLVRGDGATNPAGRAELDLVMAAALHGGGCASAADCADDNPCTAEACVDMLCEVAPEPAGTRCEGGVCDGADVPECVECLEDVHCSGVTPRCDVVARVCVTCLDASDCDDGNECTADQCSAQACEAVALPAGTDCSIGTCDGVSPEPRCLECQSDAECGEFAPRCVTGRCVSCVAHADCDDADPCTEDRCDIDGACISVPVSTPACVGLDGGVDGGAPDDSGPGTDAIPPGPSGGCACQVSEGPAPLTWTPLGALLLFPLMLGRRRAR